jgi:hypothetical protein
LIWTMKIFSNISNLIPSVPPFKIVKHIFGC